MRHVFHVGAAHASSRLDQTLAAFLPDFSRSRLQKLIRAGLCSVNGETAARPDMRLAGQEEIIIDIPETEGKLQPEAGDLKIVWRDEDFALVDKEAGLVTHPCPSHPQDTLAQRLVAHFPELAGMTGERPGIAHRLDKDTSGLLLVALNEPARLKLSAAFARREIHKEYLALVYGNPPAAGECAQPIGRHPTIKTRMAIVSEKQGGKPALSRWRKLWTSPDESASLLAVRIFTGRTHQIRVHLAHAGYPILGDAVYAPRQVAVMAKRQMLHAWRLSFTHMIKDTEMSFQADPPEDLVDTALAASSGFQLMVVTGSPGCGKSTFCKELENLGLPVISSDAIVGAMYAARGEAAAWLERHFGSDLLLADGSINKSALFEKLHASPSFRGEFEPMIHGLVFDEITTFAENQKRLEKPFAAVEIPLYFECGTDKLEKWHPFVIGIHCPDSIRWKRIKKSRGWTDEKIQTLEKWQWTEKRKMAACDAVVSNTGDEKELARQACEMVEALKAAEKARTHEIRQRMEKITSARPRVK